MKKKIYILGLSVLLACSACEDWLTIQPETTVAAETLFKTDVGITQGLNGAYYTASQSMHLSVISEDLRLLSIWQILIIAIRK